MRVRNGTAEDIKDIKALYWLLDTDAILYQPDHFTRAERPDEFILSVIQDEKSEFLLLEIDYRVVGFSLVQEKSTPDISCLKKEKYVAILDLVVAEAYRGKGLGAILLNKSKEWGLKRKTDFLRLSVFAENTRGIEFYERNGLRERMRTMEYRLQ